MNRPFRGACAVKGKRPGCGSRHFFFGARIRLGAIIGRFSINYFSGLGLRIRVRVRVRVWVSVVI